ncbi:zinc finger CCCH domain-containing protein 65-like isoform X2 [Zingiber officinale]|uniref:zinc finger CCCH domain-containing protein 65-like isoform X2 n=1 Tax=Zingiber officinale TaxID=94328 RepID=UPI001C4CD150|nr:zinc finger CCCH domain-containing protein 65-like isoform X2 [Zingiber officinale]
MGFVEAKLVLNNDELPPSPSLHSLDVVLADVARLEVGEKPGNGVDAPGIAVAQANAGVEPDPGSPKKGVEEAEKEVPMQFPQRSEAPDCAFYMKTGACKFGSACKFNHPPKRRKPRVRAKKGAENVQLPKNAKGKQKECLFKKDDKVEKQTSSRRLQQEDCKFQKNAIGKQMPPFKKFEQSEEKADQMERHWLRSEQDDSKFQNKAVGKQIPPFKKVVQTEKKADEVEKNCSTSGKEDSKIPKNFIGKQMPPFKKFVQIEEKIPKNFIGKQIPLKKFVQIEEKTDEVEKHCSMSELEDSKTDKVEKHCSTSELEDSKLQKNAIRKQKRLFKKFEQTEKKTDEAEKQCSMLEQEDREFQKNAIEKQIPLFKRFEQTEKKSDKVEKQSSRSEQEDSKADEVEKHSRWEQEDSKATEKMSKEAISGNIGIGIPECKFYKTSGKCKYGKSCKYTHSLKKIEVAPLALNFLGLPVRPGEKECPYYICTGNCKYAANCKYHHPEPTVATLEQGALPACQIGGSEQQISCGVSSLPVTPSPTQGAFHFLNPLTAASSSLPLTECNGYQIDPKRPGETECQYHSKISHLNAQGN